VGPRREGDDHDRECEVERRVYGALMVPQRRRREPEKKHQQKQNHQEEEEKGEADNHQRNKSRTFSLGAWRLVVLFEFVGFRLDIGIGIRLVDVESGSNTRWSAPAALEICVGFGGCCTLLELTPSTMAMMKQPLMIATRASSRSWV